MTNKKYMKPGLRFAVGKLVEELGELQAALGKTMRFGFDSYDPTVEVADRESNIDMIFREINDVENALENFKIEWSWATPSVKEEMFTEDD